MAPSDPNTPNLRRSQAILRMPVDYVDATLILHDGERSEVIFFVPPREQLAAIVTAGDAFVPVMREAKIMIVSRAAIACVGVRGKLQPDSDELPSEKQRVAVKLRSGTVLEGELTWTIVDGKQRTADYLNGQQGYVVLRAGELEYIVIKEHIATVKEL